MRTKLTSLVVVLSLGAASAAAAQSAGSADAPRQEVVRYHDLNLATASGVDVLQARIDRAARKVCGPEPLKMELQSYVMYRDCVSAARNSAAEPVALAVAKARERATELARR